MPSQNNINIKQLIEKWLINQPTICFAVLFGSYAKGTYHNNSDIDLAIELNTPMTSEKKLLLLQSLGEITGKIIDLVDLKTIGQPLLNQIIQHGKILKGSEDQYINLSIRNVNSLQDFAPYIERTLKERRKRLLNE